MATPKNRSVLKAFSILRAFGPAGEPLTSAELSRRAGLPEASGYRLIQTLEMVGAVVRDGRGRYRPGFVLTGPPAPALLGESLKLAAQPVLEDLAEAFGATSHLGVLEHGMVTYVAKASAASSVAVPTREGAQQEAYCSAIGKVLLAALDGDELEAFLEEGALVPLTQRTITDPARFRREIAAVRQSGFALDRGEAHPHLGCVAAPVHNASGRTIMAVSVVDRIERVDEARRRDMRAALSRAARTLASRWEAIGGGLAAPPASPPGHEATAQGAATFLAGQAARRRPAPRAVLQS